MKITIQTKAILIARKVPPELKKRLPTRKEIWELAKLQYTPEKAEKIITTHNTITYGGYNYFAMILSLQSGYRSPINAIKYGNSGKEPSISDASLHGDTQHNCNETNPYYEGNYTVDFVGYIAYNSGNNLTIREAGVYREASSTMLARWVFPGGWKKSNLQDACIIWKLRVK